eukprot:CAMPEP_0184353214 /NCGR_PEP_ID=MMETSP1089-20130417/76106_1 /TAXON_ID=38269 ORGANISM="Gloeochaete wittrockiana, Strain SAG46.84" /NCGR_SAMPLE_ID=MMETSP1089 /ASSEMBLY_ACC=CAM_ASM_000445 /LENGTH=60 /DNA_ID=CAMNT_0026688427 /DNA_START=53 /DNA_END=235 /DNA_ORIENTATION=+
MTAVAGFAPSMKLARYTNGLKAEPGWRDARARLYWLNAKLVPPTRALTAPVPGSTATNAP